MTINPTVIPGLVVLAAEFITLAGVGYVVVRTVLRQTDERAALAQGLVVGLSLWGVLAWRTRRQLRPQPLVVAGFAATAVVLFWAALASRQALSVSDPHSQLGLAA